MDSMKEKTKGATGMFDPLLSGIGWAGDKAQKFLQGHGMGKLLVGSKVDFPAIWKGASYSTGYNITVRLYNPWPSNNDAYEKHILQPLLWLLAFVIPQNDQGEDGASMITYHSPVLCTVHCPGLWHIRAGFVSSIEVVKGGENNDISFKHHPGMVDIRLSFGELYGVMTTNDNEQQDRLTIGKYMKNLRDEPQGKFDMFGGISTTEAPAVEQNPSNTGSQYDPIPNPLDAARELKRLLDAESSSEGKEAGKEIDEVILVNEEQNGVEGGFNDHTG